MRMIWLRFGVGSVLFAVACSEDMSDPFADGSFSAGDHEGDASASASAAGSESGTGDGGDTTGDAPGTTGAATSDGADGDDGAETTGDAEETGPAIDTGTDDDGESSTTDPAMACADFTECQPCVDCTVQAGGDCQDEALACQSDAECNALAGCYNGCAMQLMGDELDVCVQGCYDEHPDAVATFQSAYGCFLDVCGALCPSQ